MIIRFLFFILFSGLSVFVSAQNSLTIELIGLRSTSGCVLLSLYNAETGFPNKPENAFKKAKIEKVKATSLSYVFDNLSSGTYAVSIFHDEDCNGEMKTNVLGIPQEGTGASNDARGKFGPPKYADAKFQFTGNKKITLKMWYF